MLQHGFDVHLISDGEIHRFKGPEDKRPNGWYVFHGGHGAFGNWKTGVVVKWSDRGKLTDSARRDLDQQIRKQRKARHKEREQRQQAAAAEAKKLWQHAIPVLSHPYLEYKKVTPHGIRQSGEALIIPMYRNRELRSVQRIFADGRKRFLKNGDIYATYYPMGQIDDQLWIAEGFATAASVFEASGAATACAFSGVNMAKVARAFRKRYPDLDIRIAGDAGGERYADKAMIACLGKSALPVFDDDDDGSDWNDFTCLYGTDTTKEALYGRV